MSLPFAPYDRRHYATVGIEEGAHFMGSIEMDPAAVEKALGKSRPEATAKPAAGKANSESTARTRPGKSAKGADGSPDAPGTNA